MDALKQTKNNKLPHVMCAVAVPEVQFTNVPERTQIDVDRIPLQRLKLVYNLGSHANYVCGEA